MMAAPPDHRRQRIPFEPALDGLRGIGMLATMGYHAGFAWAGGSFLAISMFFTLSGFLITALFLAEWEGAGRIQLGSFWGRRFRRLMPMALLTLAGMTAFGFFVATPDQLQRLRADVVWSLFYGANWHFLFSGAAYTRLFEAPSPLQHFWSLAIEEQYYAVFPLLVVGVLARWRSRRAFGSAIFVLLLASLASSIALTTAGASIDRVYYGSDTRAAEILMGCLLAVAIGGRPIQSPALTQALRWLGPPALFGMLGLWVVVDLESRWLYLGGLAGYSLLAAWVIAAGIQPDGFVRSFLSAAPLRWVGRISYGAYLIHWPVFLWLNEERTGLGTAALFALRVAATLAAAELTFRFFEAPIRAQRMLQGWRPFAATPVAFALVIAGAVAVTDGGGGAGAVRPEAVARVDAFVERMRALEVPENEAPPGLGRERPRMAVFGDSTAVTLGIGLGEWLEREGGVRMRLGVAELGCGIARLGTYRFRGDSFERPDHCADRRKAWPDALGRARADVAIVSLGPWDVCDRRLPGDERWRAPGDPVLDAYLRRELREATELLLESAPLVLWIAQPAIRVRDAFGAAPTAAYPEADPERMQRFNDLLHELEGLHPGRVRVIDLAGYLRSLPDGEFDPAYRPDGTHYSVEGSIRVAREWLGQAILRAYRKDMSP